MHILGLNDSNSAAALVRDGQLIAAAREERFDRRKFSDDFPHGAVSYCLREAGIEMKDLDQVVFAWNPGHEIEPLITSAPIREHRNFLHYVPNNLLRHVPGAKENKRIASMSQAMTFADGRKLDILFAPHHHCHAASAFFVSPFEDAAVMTLDAYGDDISHAFFHGRGNHLEPLGRTLFPHSLGQVYAALTQYLGYRANSDEWKVMGLAAYGETEFLDFFRKLFRYDRALGELRFDLDYFTYYVWSPRRYSDQFVAELGPERQGSDELTQRHMNIAASFQRRVEEVALEMAVHLHERTGSENLCLAGGVCMNSKMNGRILEEGPFRRVFVQPSADDAGGSLGACFHYWNQVLGRERGFVQEHDYWGPGYSDEEIREVLLDARVSFETLADPEGQAAESIAAGRVVAWFQGRMENGQRALGNRSILADARDPGMKDRINRLVKHREWYRPFAPAVLEECQSEFFENAQPSRYMQMVYTIRPEARGRIPAVTHQDGTGRIQTVRRDLNPKYWGVIDAFRQRTGVGVILNTSFNGNDEPIVCSPVQALRTFFSTGLDELYIGPFRLRKPDLA